MAHGENNNEGKRIAFETLYDRGRVRVGFSMLHEGVELPSSAKSKSENGFSLALDYSIRFNMPQFKIDDSGIRAVLTFNGKSAMTSIPWEAVLFLAQNDEIIEVWPYINRDLGVVVVPGVADAQEDLLGADNQVDVNDEDVKWIAPIAEG